METEANRRRFSLKGAFLRYSFLKKISLIVLRPQPEFRLSARMCWGRRKTSLAGFTLIELIAVVIIVAILISLAVPQYTKTIERAKEKEAIANLKLMQAAQKIYKLEQGFFYPGSGGPSIDEINENLRLDLNENQWQYNVPATGTDDDFSAMAYRGDWKTRTYSIDQDLTEPVCSPSANCP